MLLVWQGLGLAAFVIPFFVIVAIIAVANLVLGVPGATVWATFLVGVSLLISAELIRRVAIRLDRRPARVLVDKETGQEVELRERHTFFFVPLRYWVWIEAAGGILAAVLGVSTSSGSDPFEPHAVPVQLARPDSVPTPAPAFGPNVP